MVKVEYLQIDQTLNSEKTSQILLLGAINLTVY